MAAASLPFTCFNSVHQPHAIVIYVSHCPALSIYPTDDPGFVMPTHMMSYRGRTKNRGLWAQNWFVLKFPESWRYYTLGREKSVKWFKLRFFVVLYSKYFALPLWLKICWSNMNIRMNSYIIRGISTKGTGVIPPPPVHSCLKNQMSNYLEQSWAPPHLLKSWLSAWLCKKYTHTHPGYLMVHPIASQCGFFLISDPAITIGATPPHSVQCIVLYCIGDGHP